MPATVTYESPIAGATAPTATQAYGHNEVVASVTAVLYDVAATITHNMGLTAAEVAAGFPEVQIEPKILPASQPFVATYGANSVVLTLNGTADQFRVRIKRPQSKFK